MKNIKMKRICYLNVFFCILVFGLLSCSKEAGESQPQQTPAKTEKQQEKKGVSKPSPKLDQVEAFAMKYSYAWSNQMPERVASFFAEDGILQVNDDPPAKGREAIAKVAQGFMTDLPDMEVRFDRLEQGEKAIEFHWTLIATNSGPDGNGNKINVSGYEEWTLNDNGLIQSSKGHFPTEEYDKQRLINKE